MRGLMLTTVVAVSLVATAHAAASSSGWVVVKRGPTAAAGELAIVGGIVRRPGRVAVRVVVSAPRSITISVVMSCRKGLGAGVGRSRLTVRATATKQLRLPVAGADNCAVSATGTNPAGTLRLDLLRSP